MLKKRLIFHSVFIVIVGFLIALAFLYPFNDENCGYVGSAYNYDSDEINQNCIG